MVAGLADQAPEAGAFGADDDRRDREMNLVVGRGPVRGEADRPDAGLLNLLDRRVTFTTVAILRCAIAPAEVFPTAPSAAPPGAPGESRRRRRRHPRAQDGAEVVRILDAVQDDEQGRGRRRGDEMAGVHSSGVWTSAITP